ncbi:MAG: redoxin domain-containing protein [Bacteroidales bacterium]|nr:redoxin domain-containing protein [Bacteroidales bacterium]
MKILLFIVPFLLLTNLGLFNKDLILIDSNKKEVNLNEIDLQKDSVLIVLWHFRCSPCIRELDQLKEMHSQKNIQIMAVGINLGYSFDEEINLIKKHDWPFSFYFDSGKELQDYLIAHNLMRKDKYFKNKNNDRYTIAVPQAYLFVKGKFISNKVTIENKCIKFN